MVFITVKNRNRQGDFCLRSTLRTVLSSLLPVATHRAVLLIRGHPRMHLSSGGLARRQRRGRLGGAVRGHLRVSLHEPCNRQTV